LKKILLIPFSADYRDYKEGKNPIFFQLQLAETYMTNSGWETD
jgi:hypothetical protein